MRYFRILARTTALIVLLLARATMAEAQAAADPAQTYHAAANRLIEAALADSAAYERLAELTDRFGHRFSGSASLEHAIDWILEEMRDDGLANVRGEPVTVPRWVRGQESATLIEPRQLAMPMLGLGGSIGTPPEGITAEVLVVESYEELERRAAEARGKIVLFDAPFTSYGETVQYRSGGAIAAARAGALASLIRSVASYSMRTPHTGNMRYEDGVPQIPHAALSVEDAAMLHRMQDRGERVVIRLQMNAQTMPPARSRNVVAEIVGSEFPDEVIVMGGHIDSWDVGTGAMDDAGGCVAAWEALRLIHTLGLRPKRTIRVVMWTNEENGLGGGNAYRDAHRNELDKHVLAIESDNGVFRPTGFSFTGSDQAHAILERVAQLLEPIGAASMTSGGGGADIGPIMALGVPGMSPVVDGTRYFWYHHSEADTVDKLDPREVAQVVAGLAVIAYVVADLPQPLPR
jgi:carboxypeptidase Q